MKTGFTTVTFRSKSREDQIRLASKAELFGIEWGGDVHVVPGDIPLAEDTAKLTREAGLAVLSYGSYFRTDSAIPGDGFAPVLDTAAALGAPIIRVWAGSISPAEADENYRSLVAENARVLCGAAEERGITVAFEYHRGTLTENAGSALSLLRAVGMPNMKCYWQPNPDITAADNLSELRQLLPYLAAVHLFQWTRGNVRHPLQEGIEDWTLYLSAINDKTNVNFILEFCMDDSEEQFLKDASTLRKLVLPKAVLFSKEPNNIQIDKVFIAKTRRRLRRSVLLGDEVFTSSDLERCADDLKDVKYLFSTWDMAELRSEQIKTYLPNLRCVFHAAGTVQYFARPFLENGIRVHSAWGANGVPVAEYTVAQIILANKGYFQAALRRKRCGHPLADSYARSFPGNFDIKVGILGVGMIGTIICRMLQQYRLEVLVFDPFASDEKLASLGAKRASLEDIFSQCQTISNHLANNDETRGLLDYRLFSKMKPNAVFINTGRGAQVNEDDLVRALTEEPDRTAVLDVTDPEPCPEGHPFYSMENVILTPHMAGSYGNEVVRMGEYMAEECEKTLSGQPCRYSVTLEMLKTMA